MDFDKLYLLLPLVGGAHIFIAAFRTGKAIRNNSPQTAYHELDGAKLNYRSAQLNGVNYGLCLEFCVSKECLGLRCHFPKFNFVTTYSEIQVSKVKSLFGHRVSLLVPNIGELILSRRLAAKINEMSAGKISYESIT